MSSSDCYFLTCIQVSQEAGQVVWYSHLFQNFPQFIVIRIVKGFGIVNKVMPFLKPTWPSGMWELDYKESWAQNWCSWTVVLQNTPESPLDCKERQPMHPKGDQSWVFIGRTDVEAETPILWSPDAKSWLIWKDPNAGKDWRQEEKGTTEDEMVGWHHRLKGNKFQ